MAEPRRRQLSARCFRKPTVSKTSLFCVLLAGLALNLCPLITFYTDTDNPDLCFVNWRNVLFIGYCFIKLGIALLWCSVRQSVVRYGLWRVIACCLFVVLTSYLIVTVALDSTALMMWGAFETNFIKRFEANVVTINETRTEFTERDIRTYEPLKLERQMRYIGEDARLVCEETLYFENKVRFHEKQVIWKHNKNRIESSSRYHIKTEFEEIPKNDKMKLLAEILEMDFYIYHVKSELDIYLIEEADFGKFSCHVAKTAIKIDSKSTTFGPEHTDNGRDPKGQGSNDSENSQSGSKYTKDKANPERQTSSDSANSHNECPPIQEKETTCPCPREELHLLLKRARPLFYTWNAEILLKKISSNRRTISVPVGSIVSSSASYTHLDDRPIDFDHEINGESFVDTCSGFDQSCSLLIYIYWFFWHDGGHFTFIPAFYQRLQMVEGVGGTSWQCVCPYTYGVHRFVFYREFYNRTIGMYQMVGIEYPDSVEILPEEPNILNPYFNGTKQKVHLPETACWGDFSRTVCVYLERILQSLASDFFFKERVLCISGILLCVIIAYLSYKLIFVWITNLCINFILGRNRNVSVHAVEGSGTLAGLANMNNTVLKYDLFISCASEQNHLASEASSYLQSRGLRVSHCDADVLGNEITTQGISRLITESWKFLVIVTPDYVNSGLQNNFEMQLILQRLHDGYINENNIALMSSEPDLIPDIFTIFTIFNWPRDHIAYVYEHIRNWIGPSLFPSDLFTSATVIRENHFQFTSAYILSFTCFCFCSLYFIVFRGSTV